MNTYPGDILAEVEWLSLHLNESNVRLVDVRASDPRLPMGYRASHIPQAVALDVGREFFLFANGARQLGEPAQIAQALAQRGIANDTLVVIYDEWTGQLASFTYWVLRYVGHRNIRVLH